MRTPDCARRSQLSSRLPFAKDAAAQTPTVGLVCGEAELHHETAAVLSSFFITPPPLAKVHAVY